MAYFPDNSDKSTTPDDDTPIWQYMDLWKFLDLLRGSIFFPSIDEYRKGDKYEGDFPPVDPATLPRFVKDIDDLHNRTRRTVYASCWHMNDVESAAMWSLYSKLGEGVAIKSTVGKLKNCFGKEKIHKIRVSEITYIPFTDPVPWDRIYLFKKESYEHEKELRTFFNHPDGLEAIEVVTGKLVEVLPDVLLEKVIVGPQCGAHSVDTVKETLKNFGFASIPCERSILAK